MILRKLNEEVDKAYLWYHTRNMTEHSVKRLPLCTEGSSRNSGFRNERCGPFTSRAHTLIMEKNKDKII